MRSPASPECFPHRDHSAACDVYEHRDGLYGVGSTALTAIVGSTLFVTLQNTTSEAIRIIAGLVAIVAAIASGIQTFAKYGQLAERYRQASRGYSAVARRIDELLADPPPAAQIGVALDQLRKSLDDTGALAPNVPPGSGTPTRRGPASIPTTRPWSKTATAHGRMTRRRSRRPRATDQPRSSASITAVSSATTSPEQRTAASPSCGVRPWVTIAIWPPARSVMRGSWATG